MISSRSSRQWIAVVALAGALAAASGAGAASQRAAGDNLCKLSASSGWKKAEAAIQAASPKVDAALGGQNVKDGMAAAKAMANGLRDESKLLAKASGDRKVKDALAKAYDQAAKSYDLIADKLPVLAGGLKAAQKGDLKAMTKVMDVLGKVMEPAAKAMGALSVNWSDLLKGCK
jgi:hypothetical protein